MAALKRIREERKPIRFVVSRLLWATRLCQFLTIQTPYGRVRFSPTAMGAGLWSDPNQYTGLDYDWAKTLLRPGDTFIDIGANIGLFSLIGARAVGADGCVLSVEPHPRVFRWLEDNLELGNYHNVRTVCAAASSRSGWAKLSDRRSDDQNGLARTGISVPIVTVDEIAETIDHIRLLKIDVEGNEPSVIEGAAETLSRTDAVIVEDWDGSSTTLLQDAGFLIVDAFGASVGPSNVLAVSPGTASEDRVSELANDGRRQRPR